MISTGIVRSIDSLGRVVLPKELRTTYDITPDTPLEIFTDGVRGLRRAKSGWSSSRRRRAARGSDAASSAALRRVRRGSVWHIICKKIRPDKIRQSGPEIPE